MTVDPHSIRKLLVIKLRAMGDVLLSTIVTKNLRLAFPDARIDYLTEPPSLDILRRNPFVNNTHLYDRATMSGMGLIRMVRRESYDLVIDLFGNPRTGLLTRLSGAKYRVGYRFRWRTYAYNIIAEPRGALVHNTQFNLDAIEAIGVAIQDRNIYFRFLADDEVYVDKFFPGAQCAGKILVAFSTGGGWYTKRWGIDRFAELADRLIEYHNAFVMLTWGPGQLSDVERLQSLMRNEVFIPPATTLPQLGALLKRSAIVISNDAGPMHIAAAVGTPIVGIFGPTNPKLQGPYKTPHTIVRNESLDCLGCNLTKCPIGHPCMLELSVDSVLSSVEHLLKQTKITA